MNQNGSELSKHLKNLIKKINEYIQVESVDNNISKKKKKS
jgi:hypothetical protein